jgi:hypothetical protein
LLLLLLLLLSPAVAGVFPRDEVGKQLVHLRAARACVPSGGVVEEEEEEVCGCVRACVHAWVGCGWVWVGVGERERDNTERLTETAKERQPERD